LGHVVNLWFEVMVVLLKWGVVISIDG